ncbi:MAG TPA: RHS repeat-associated core domain-containing protein [Candidatus Limnocylindrales bacterium]
MSLYRKRSAVLAAGALLLTVLAGAPPAAAKPAPTPTAQKEPVVVGSAFKPKENPVESTGTPYAAAPPVWPAPSKVEAGPWHAEALDKNQDDGLTVESFDRATALSHGVDGVLMRVSRRSAGAVRLTVNYQGFRSAYGAGWASRLSLYVDGARVPSRNDHAKGTVEATVQIGTSSLVALAAGPSGAGGDFKATSLSPSATWSAGGNSGDFAWTYPLRMPPGLNGPAPKVELGYSSASLDGRMASTNNQASWVGDGFDFQPGHIERRYNGCAEDMGSGANNSTKTGDLCWETDNAALTLDGHSGELIKDGGDPNRWHLRKDDGTYVERRTGGPNGDNNGEWWLVRTSDGSQYWFGGRSGSSATLTVPVFGNHSGEPCHASGFADSHCTQGYRWYLDHVVDPHGNTMSYTYKKLTNKYGRNLKAEDDTVYDREGYLEKVEYGTRTGGTASAPARVLFGVADRCLSGCANEDAAHWPDVPWDQVCKENKCGLGQISPTFFSTTRLSTVTTQIWSGLGYKDIERWTLTHSFPSSDQPTLWLEKISHTGLAGGTLALPDITFSGVPLPNRVDTNNDQYPALTRYRMKSIVSESGGKTDLTYTGADCVKGTRVPDKANLHLNALRCYPVRWTPEGDTDPITDFFHRYLVSDVVEADLSGMSSRVITHYDYVGDPAWHYTDDDGFLKKANKTWSVWRGYDTVRTVKGDPGQGQTAEQRRYFRGMHGDRLPSGTRSVLLPAIGAAPAVNDEDAFSGMLRETVTLNGPGGAEVSAKVNEPWQSAPTATRTINGSTVTARFADIAAEHNRTALDRGRPARTTSKRTTFDGSGKPVRVDDAGDNAVAGDEKCVLTDYVRNTSAWILETRSRERSFAVGCAVAAGGGGLTDDDVVDDKRFFYDQQAWNVAPVKGDLTRTEVLKAYNGGNPVYKLESASKHDSYGRVVEATDKRGAVTKTAYTPESGALVTTKTETSPLGWTKTTQLEPAFDVPLTTLDANGRRIDFAYDPLGRLVSVWMAGRDRVAHPNAPSITYQYLLRNNAPTVVVSKKLNGTSYRFYDSLLRERQSQEADKTGNTTRTVVTDTYHDSAGRPYKTHDPYVALAAPGTNLFLPSGNIPSLKVNLYDGAGRTVALVQKENGPPASEGGTEKWRTTTVYGGDRTDVTPPVGGIATSTVKDAADLTVELRQYRTGVTPGSDTGFDRTTYRYNRKGKLATLTDAAGNVWEHGYDVTGREVRTADPDKGVTTTVYDDFDDVVSTTDSRGVTIAYTYDAIGRKLTLRDGSPGGPKRAEWVYDTLSNGVPAKGHIVKTIRYEGEAQYSKEYQGFTADYKATGIVHTIPATPGTAGVAGSYTYGYSYHPDGTAATTRLPGMGDLGPETLTRGYNRLAEPTTLSTTLGLTYVTGTDYTSFGEVAVLTLRNNSGLQAFIARDYETGTRRLTRMRTERAAGMVADVRYAYDAAGGVTGISDATSGDHQCFTMDHVRRLEQAWTPADGDCVRAPSSGALGGPGKYWHSYAYDAAGNRTRLVERSSGGDVTTDYSVTGHRLDAAGGKSYTYDQAGHMLTRPAPGGGSQTMSWDAEGRLAASTDTTGTTSYVYDVDGNRLLRKDPGGTTLYLPDQELRYSNGSGRLACTRYYTHHEQVIATRTAAGVVWLGGDHQGTAEVTIDAVAQAAAVRRQTPFGVERSAEGAWPSTMDKGFVGGTKDNTGLTHLGAREYDAGIGRFISVDPVIDDKDPQQLHGYAYANNSPVSASDPDGLWPGWLKSAASAVTNTVSNVASTVASGATAAGKWVYDNAGIISTVAGVASLVCTVVPPLQVVAPALGAIAAVTGAIDTAKSCVAGAAVDCAVGLVGMIPGARTLKNLGSSFGTAAKGLKGWWSARKTANTAVDGYFAGMRQGLHTPAGFQGMQDALGAQSAAWWGMRQSIKPQGFIGHLDSYGLYENAGFAVYSLAFANGQSRQDVYGNSLGIPTWGGYSSGSYSKYTKSKPATTGPSRGLAWFKRYHGV